MKTAALKPDQNRLLQNQRGIALLLILWIITFLTVICAEFSWTMRTEIAITTNYREGVQAYYTAEAGINRAIIELMRTASSRGVKKSDEVEEGDNESSFWEPGAGSYSFKLNDGMCEVTIEDEGNKIGLNSFLKKAKKNPALLKKLLKDKIGLEGERLDIVADSMIDWWDKDHNITGVNGTEDAYYEALDTPYECRDSEEIPVVGELLLIRGIDEEIFYGRAGKPEYKTKLSTEELEQILSGNLQEETSGEEDIDNETDDPELVNPGLGNIFSVTSRSSRFKININTASAEQLLMLKSMDTSTALEIIGDRKERRFESKTDRLPQYKNYEVWKNEIITTSSKSMGFYKIKARGISTDGNISRKISCEVMITRHKCMIMNWQTID